MTTSQPLAFTENTEIIAEAKAHPLYEEGFTALQAIAPDHPGGLFDIMYNPPTSYHKGFASLFFRIDGELLDYSQHPTLEIAIDTAQLAYVEYTRIAKEQGIYGTV